MQVNEVQSITQLSATNSSLATFAYQSFINADADGTANAGNVWKPCCGGSTTETNGRHADPVTPGVLIVDVDRLRVLFIDAIEALENKLDTIVNIPTLSCQ